jgi:hypothetical protein
MNLKAEFNRTLSLLRAPGHFLENLDRRSMLKDSLRMLAVLLAIATVLYFLLTLLNLTELRLQTQAMRSYGPPSALPALLQDGLPYNRLLFPIFWFCLIFYGGAIRHVLIRMLGEPDPDLARTQTIGIYASIPLILLSIPSFALGALFPFIPGPGAQAGGSAITSFAAVMGTLLLLGGLIWHAILVVKGLRTLYNQNTGRAILTWAFAPVTGTFLCCGLWFGGYFIALMLAGGAGQ